MFLRECNFSSDQLFSLHNDTELADTALSQPNLTQSKIAHTSCQLFAETFQQQAFESSQHNYSLLSLENSLLTKILQMVLDNGKNQAYTLRLVNRYFNSQTPVYFAHLLNKFSIQKLFSINTLIVLLEKYKPNLGNGIITLDFNGSRLEDFVSEEALDEDSNEGEDRLSSEDSLSESLENEPLNSQIRKILSYCPKLETIDFGSLEGISDETLTSLTLYCPRLCTLKISNCDYLTDVSLNALRDNSKYLKALHITDSSLFTDEGLLSLTQACQSLNSLSLSNCTQLSTQAIAKALEHLRIQHLDLSSCIHLEDHAVTGIAKSPYLEKLSLSHCILLTDQLLKALSNSSSLQQLDLSGCQQFSNEAIQELKNCPELQVLSLYECSQLTEETLLSLSKCAKLRVLSLSQNTHVSSAIIEMFTKKGIEIVKESLLT